MYDVLAPVYDRWQKAYGKEYSAIILPRLLSTIDELKIPTSTLVDVACGTGALAFMMAQRGWKVCGVDGSKAMNAVAERKRKRRDLPVSFSQQDMRTFSLDDRFDLATCFFDSLNHLLEGADLLKTFERVHAHLTNGGWFVFDVNTLHCFKTLWNGKHGLKLRNIKLVFDSKFDEQQGVAYCDVFMLREGKQRVEPHHERVFERYFSKEQISSLLARAGFRVHSFEDFNFTPLKDAGLLKTWWVAQKS